VVMLATEDFSCTNYNNDYFAYEFGLCYFN
jgi:hypothetical protein